METHFSLPRAYYRGADGILLVYDVTSLVSFNNLEKWLHQIERHASSDAVIMLLGNKFDKVIEMGDKQQVCCSCLFIFLSLLLSLKFQEEISLLIIKNYSYTIFHLIIIL